MNRTFVCVLSSIGGLGRSDLAYPLAIPYSIFLPIVRGVTQRAVVLHFHLAHPYMSESITCL